MNAMLTIKIVMMVAFAAAGATTTNNILDIFAQKESSYMDQLINECMYNNVTACNTLEHYNSTTYPR
jgi:hypothetical protein